MTQCIFCQHKMEPYFKDIENLEKMLTSRKKIVSAEKTRVCANHQRKLSKQIKYARYMALLPYTSYQGT